MRRKPKGDTSVWDELQEKARWLSEHTHHLWQHGGMVPEFVSRARAMDAGKPVVVADWQMPQGTVPSSVGGMRRYRVYPDGSIEHVEPRTEMLPYTTKDGTTGTRKTVVEWVAVEDDDRRRR